MTVKELLDKQYNYTPVLISEDCDYIDNVHSAKTSIYLEDDINRDIAYEKYGDREVEYFTNFFDSYGNRIIMSIKIVNE